jgi:hypothetical protein
MDDEDLLAIITEIVAQLEGVGAFDVADEMHYVQLEAEAGEMRPLAPIDHVKELLMAFDRHVAIQAR